jgi:hypothetical protein
LSHLASSPIPTTALILMDAVHFSVELRVPGNISLQKRMVVLGRPSCLLPWHMFSFK